MPSQTARGNCTGCGCVVAIDLSDLRATTGSHGTLREGPDGVFIPGAVCDYTEPGHKAALNRVALLRRAAAHPSGCTTPEVDHLLQALQLGEFDYALDPTPNAAERLLERAEAGVQQVLATLRVDSITPEKG